MQGPLSGNSLINISQLPVQMPINETTASIAFVCRTAGLTLMQSQQVSWTWLWTACWSHLKLRSSSFLLALLAAGQVLSLTDQSVIVQLNFASMMCEKGEGRTCVSFQK